MKKILKILLIVLILIILLVSIPVIYIYDKLNKVNYTEIPAEEIEVTEGVEEKLEKYRNIALFGIDDVKGYEGRSDCIIIFSLNEETKKVKMTSIYRDTYVEVPKHGYTKINHAYAYGDEALAMSTINRNLDLDITEFVTINFKVVKDLVNKVGGVTVDVTKAEVGQIPGIKKAGTYNLNGEQALAYGRIRKIDTDYKRTERMRTIISKVFEKVKQMSVTEINDVADQILPELKTNIKKSEITATITDALSYEIGESMGWPYEVKGKTIDGVWYGVPATLEDSVKKMHKELFNEEDYEVSKTVKEISQKIVKKTGVK